MQESTFEQRIQRIEDLVGVIERSSDPAARDAAREMVRALLDLHARGLRALLDLVTGEKDRSDILRACAEDELVGSLLLLHDLHPDGLEFRVQQALESVRPYLNSHGGGIELLEIAEGTVRLRMQGSCDGCPSSRLTIQSTIEQAIYEAAPDVSGIEVEGLLEDPPPGSFVPLEITR